MYGAEIKLLGGIILRDVGIFIQILTCNPDILDMKNITLLLYDCPIAKPVAKY